MANPIYFWRGRLPIYFWRGVCIYIYIYRLLLLFIYYYDFLFILLFFGLFVVVFVSDYSQRPTTYRLCTRTPVEIQCVKFINLNSKRKLWGFHEGHRAKKILTPSRQAAKNLNPQAPRAEKPEPPSAERRKT